MSDLRQYECQIEGYHTKDEFIEWAAETPRAAAETFVECHEHDNVEFNKGPYAVLVRRGDSVSCFSVSTESVMVYTAKMKMTA